MSTTSPSRSPKRRRRLAVALLLAAAISLAGGIISLLGGSWLLAALSLVTVTMCLTLWVADSGRTQGGSRGTAER